MALDLISDYITEARRLLQDQTVPYRYPDADLIAAMNIATMEARRVRPDLYMVQARTLTVPSFANLSDAVAMDYQYRPSFVYYLVGRMALRDDETEEDQRATVLMNKFIAQLLSVQS